MDKLRLARPIQFDSVVDGPGLRLVIWMQGCIYACPGCHNPSTHDLKGGFEIDTKEVLETIDKNLYHDGVTFSGGEPLLQAKKLLPIAKYLKEHKMNIWCYTGATYNELIKEGNPDKLEMLKYIDVLVDGRFVLGLRSFDVPYRGSSNQRLIDVQKSLKENKAIDFELRNKYDR